MRGRCRIRVKSSDKPVGPQHQRGLLSVVPHLSTGLPAACGDKKATSRPLVAIKEGVITDDMKEVGGGHGKQAVVDEVTGVKRPAATNALEHQAATAKCCVAFSFRSIYDRL
jgi:hypothetical protein